MVFLVSNNYKIMNKINIDKLAAFELSSSELMSVNGGNQQSYDSGYAAGAAVRQFIDNAATEWAILKWIF
jgi:hypothetical protein